MCLCLCVSVCCMYVSHIYQSACLEVREQSLVSALAFHLLWNMVSSFLLPWTAHKLALASGYSSLSDSHPPGRAPKHWKYRTCYRGALSLACRDSSWGSYACTANALPAETSPWPLWNIFLSEVTGGCSYPKQKTGFDYRLQMLFINTASSLWQDTSILLDWKMAGSSHL